MWLLCSPSVMCWSLSVVWSRWTENEESGACQQYWLIWKEAFHDHCLLFLLSNQYLQYLLTPPPTPPSDWRAVFHASVFLSLGLSTRWVTGLPLSGAKYLVLQALSSTNTQSTVIQTDQTWWYWKFPPSSRAVPHYILRKITTISTTEWWHIVIVTLLKATWSATPVICPPYDWNRKNGMGISF